MRRANQFFTTIAVTFAVALVAVAGVNSIADPYRVMPWSDTHWSWNGGLFAMGRLGLTRMALDHDPETVVIGSSRIAFLDSAYLAEQSGRRVSSIALLLAGMESKARQAAFAERHLDADHYVIELSYPFFGPSPLDRTAFPAPADFGEVYTLWRDKPWLLPVWAYRYGLSPQATYAAVEAIARAGERQPIHPISGNVTAAGMEVVKAFHSAALGDEAQQDDWLGWQLRMWFEPDVSGRAPFTYDPAFVDRFAEEVTRPCDDDAVRCQLVITPLRTDALDLMARTGHEARREQWKQAVADATGQTIYDFSAREIVREIPNEAFYDANHIRPDASHWLLDVLNDADCASERVDCIHPNQPHESPME